MRREKILVVDDDPDIRDVLQLTLASEGYDVVQAADGEAALEQVQRSLPDVVILDYMMPRLDGGQVCQRLKKDLLLRHLPIIMLSARGEAPDKVRGLDAGADDYIVKPFEPEELLARVRMVLRRTAQDLDANPLTRLPGNVSVQRELESRLARQAELPFAVCYADLDSFKAFNDYYGFERGDEAIRETARVLLEAVHAVGNADDFIGHIGGDDFLLVTTPDRADGLCEAIIEGFDRMAPRLYQEADRQRGSIRAKDRQGQARDYAFLTISIGVVLSQSQQLSHVAEIAERGAELKSYAKTFDRSIYVKERRGA